MCPGVNYPPVVSHSTFCIFTGAGCAAHLPSPFNSLLFVTQSDMECLALQGSSHDLGGWGFVPELLLLCPTVYWCHTYLYYSQIHIYSNRFGLTSLHWSWENISKYLCNWHLSSLPRFISHNGMTYLTTWA